MLKIRDKSGKLKYVLLDEEDEPLSIDEIILRDKNFKDEKECKNKKEKN